MSLVAVRGTPSRQGSTSQLSAGGSPGSRSNSAGVLLTVGCREMRRQTNGQSLQQTSHEPDTHGVEHLLPGRYGDRPGQRRQPSRSLAHLKRSVTEVKWQEAKMWAVSRITTKKYWHNRLREPRQKPDSGPANANKRHAARFYQLETGHCLTGQYLSWTKKQPTARRWCLCRTQTREHHFKLPALERLAENSVGGGAEGDRER